MPPEVRLIIVGIAVSAVLSSFNTWIMLTAEVEDAIMAGLWGAGNLSGVDWAATLTVLGGTSVFLVAAVLLARPMKLLQIGIPFAAALGRHVRRVQMLAVVVGVGLIALATATVGPISFIALAARRSPVAWPEPTAWRWGHRRASGRCCCSAPT